MQLKVNGSVRSVTADPATPLLWVLRDELGLTGAKYGCGSGLCGSCTVHLNGRPIRSCLVSLSEALEAEVLTIEGLNDHLVQRAWLDEDVAQCGYCQTGMIMAAVALLKQHPQPSDEQIDEAFRGHLCRCGTYPLIRRAVHRAASLK